MALLNSQKGLHGLGRAPQRAWFKGNGCIDEELDRPLVAVVNTWTEIAPENVHLRTVSEAVKAGVRMNGGTPLEFNTFHVTDGIAEASTAMRYVLPNRDVCADEIELMVMGHHFDGMVLISGGDKVTPGMLMAALRLNLPAINIYCGTTPASTFKGQPFGFEDVFEGIGQVKRGNITEDELKQLEDNFFGYPGACPIASSGNTSGIYAEAMGMALPLTATLNACCTEQTRSAKRVGMRIVDLIKEDIRPRDIVTEESLKNAIRVTMAISGSTNSVIHLMAIANEIKANINLDLFDQLSRSTPTLTHIMPSGPYSIENLHNAGGVPAIMKQLGDLINPNCRTVAGKTIGDIINDAEVLDGDIIRSRYNPVSENGALFVLKGNLAPLGGIVKASAVDSSMWVHTGPAVVFESEETAIEAIYGGKIKEGDVVVIRFEGPKGAPGMREMLGATAAIKGMGLEKSTTLVTDGRFSGASRGPCIGYISPEAMAMGPIGVVRDGDMISVNLHERSLNLLISDSELKTRMDNFVLPKPKVDTGFLARYAKLVSGANEGAVLR